MSISKIPDFEALALFAKVVEDKSFAGAARNLNISVATVSRAVSRLEDKLGGQLLNRTSRKISLTELGQRMAEHAQRILRDAEDAENLGRNLSKVPRGTINFAVPMSFGLREVAPLIPEFLKRYPDIRINLHLSDAAVDIIGQGFDAALRIAVLEDSSLIVKHIRPMHRYVLAAPSYLARYGRPHTPDDLRSHHCLGYAYRPRQDIWHFRHPNGMEVSIKPTGPLSVTNVDAMLPTLLSGLAVAELPAFIADEYLADGRLEKLLGDWSLPQGSLSLVTPSLRARPAKIEALVDFFSEKLSN